MFSSLAREFLISCIFQFNLKLYVKRKYIITIFIQRLEYSFELHTWCFGLNHPHETAIDLGDSRAYTLVIDIDIHVWVGTWRNSGETNGHRKKKKQNKQTNARVRGDSTGQDAPSPHRRFYLAPLIINYPPRHHEAIFKIQNGNQSCGVVFQLV